MKTYRKWRQLWLHALNQAILSRCDCKKINALCGRVEALNARIGGECATQELERPKGAEITKEAQAPTEGRLETNYEVRRK